MTRLAPPAPLHGEHDEAGGFERAQVHAHRIGARPDDVRELRGREVMATKFDKDSPASLTQNFGDVSAAFREWTHRLPVGRDSFANSLIGISIAAARDRICSIGKAAFVLACGTIV